MDNLRFDTLTKHLAVSGVPSGSRRRLLGGLVAGALGLIGLERAESAGCRAPGRVCREDANCCSTQCNPKDAGGRRRCGCRTVADCPPAAVCHAVACQNGICVTSITPGITCDDGNPCTLGGTCSATGACIGTPVVCDALDQCHDVGTCTPATGVCSNPAKPDGAACDDGNACTQTDTCQAGDCVGGPALVCPSGQCDALAGCICGTGADCPTGYACFHGGCFLLNPSDTSQFCFDACGPSDIAILGGNFVCIAPGAGTEVCGSDADCPVGQACFANVYCIAPC